MSYFLLNNCAFNNCGKRFPTLHDLIVHIENTHIDFNPKVVEDSERCKVQFLPMSYVLRYTPEDEIIVKEEIVDEFEDVEVKTEGFVDDNVEREIEGLPDPIQIPEFHGTPQWYIPEEPPLKKESSNGKSKTKRFSCPVEGCTKRYKNQNGMKYHILNHHDLKGNLIKPKKDYKCHCGREYKTLRGLQSHSLTHKDITTTNVIPKAENYKGKNNYPALFSRNGMNSRQFVNLHSKESFKRNSEDGINYTTLDRNAFGDVEVNRSVVLSPIRSPGNDNFFNTAIYNEYGFERDLEKYTVL